MAPDDDFTEEGLEEDFDAELQQYALDEDGKEAPAGEEAPATEEVAASEEAAEGEPLPPIHEPEEKKKEVDPFQARLDHATAGIRNELKVSRHQATVLGDRMTALLGLVQQAGEADERARRPPPPTFDENPEQAIRAMIQETVEPLVEGQKAQDLEAARATLDEYANNVQVYVANDRNAFIEQNPEFLEAEKFLVLSEIRNIRLNNPNWTDDQIEQFLISSRFTPMQVNYYKAQTSMAAAIYEQAKLFGWRADGQAAPARPRGPRSPVSAKQMRSRQKQARSLAEAPRGAPRKRITTTDVLDMTDDEYARWLSGHKDPDRAEEELAKKFAVEM